MSLPSELDSRDREYYELLKAVQKILNLDEYASVRFIRSSVRESLKSALLRQKTDELKKSVDVEVDEWTSWWANMTAIDEQRKENGM